MKKLIMKLVFLKAELFINCHTTMAHSFLSNEKVCHTEKLLSFDRQRFDDLFLKELKFDDN